MISAYLVSHTHWDREWYKPYQHFRARLVYYMDYLLDLLEEQEDFHSFMLDGQTSLLEDYLEVRPEQFSRLQKLVREGRILVGPWYVQPDEFIPGAESLVRNLLLGDRISRRFGEPMKIGYLPDAFGQSAQIPHILKGFGIDAAVVMRGVPHHRLQHSEFIWEALSGDRVFAVYLPAGYVNAWFLPDNVDRAEFRLNAVVEELQKLASTDNILLMNGGDHAKAEEEIPRLIEALNRKQEKVRFIHGSLPQYLEAVRSRAPALQVLAGEMMTPEKTRVHPGCLSTRIHQKQENRRLETALTHYVEPLSVIAWFFGAEYPGGLINTAWRYLLQNQAHDSIAGCCLDLVHREIDQRQVQVDIIAETLVKGQSRALAWRMGTDKIRLLVFNNAMIPGRQLVTAELYLDDEQFLLREESGEAVPCQLEAVEDFNVGRLSIFTDGAMLQDIKKKIRFSFYADFDFHVGYRVYQVEEGAVPPAGAPPEALKVGDREMENRFLALKVNENGTIDLLDKASGRMYTGLNLFEDCGDNGDTYDFNPVDNDVPVTSAGAKADVKVVAAGPLKATLAISLELVVPERYDEESRQRSRETVALPITSWVTIYADLPRVEIRTQVENRARDHRLRVLFPSGLKTESSRAEVQFGTIARPHTVEDPGWEEKMWSAKPVPIYSQQRYMFLSDGECGMALLNRGLPEYEVYKTEEGDTVALTLFRGVGCLGRRDLSHRPGRPSGMSVPTPDAQCLGKRVAEYALVFFRGDWTRAGIPAQALEFNAPPLAVQNMIKVEALELVTAFLQVRNFTGHIRERLDEVPPRDRALFRLSGRELMISAVKKAEDEEALVVRLYNPGDRPVQGESIVLSGAPVKRATVINFNEEIVGPELVPVAGGAYALPEVPPHSALTLSFQFSPGEGEN